ncbi:uncharacterized protein DS421_14g457390 [Arachis hypogaea]|nr:uncharacterized protein DS421_14g457390 [Arachis hypogaea]
MESVAVTYGGAREKERASSGAEDRKERPAPATTTSAAQNPAAAARERTVGKGFKVWFMFFWVLGTFIVTACLFQSSAAIACYSEPLHHCCRRSGHRVWRGIELRVLIAEFYGCCIQHQGATSSPELPLLRFLDYSIELRLCLEAVATAGTVGIDAVAVG